MQSDQQIAVKKEKRKEKIFTFNFINIMLADMLIRICTQMLVVLVPLYVIEKGYSTTVAGLTTTLYMLMAVLFRPISGNLSDSKGRYVVMLIGSAVYCFATGFYVFAIPVWLLLAVRALQGLGFSFNGTAMMTMATDIIPESRMSEGIGYMGLTQTLAQAFAPALALLIKDRFNFQAAFLLIFVFALANFLSRFSLKSIDKRSGSLQESIKESQIEPIPVSSIKPEPFWTKIIDKDAWKPSMIMLLVMFTTSSIGTFLVANAISRGIENSGLFFTVSAVMIAIARLSVGKVQQRFGSVAIIAPGLAMIGLGLAGIFLSPNLSILLISSILYGLGRGGVQPEINSLAVLAASKDKRGLANSTLFMAMDLGNAAGAFAWGLIAEFTGINAIFAISAVITVLTLAGYLLYRKKGFFSVNKTIIK